MRCKVFKSRSKNSRPDFILDNVKRLKSNRSSQVFIFIAIAIIIVLFFVLYFILRPSAKSLSVNSENLNEYMKKCASDSVLQSLEIMLPQGGKINPGNYILYDGEKIEYLCYQSNWYLPCVNQYPLLAKHFEEEIKDYISPRINSCFDNIKRDLERKGYNVVMNGDKIEVSLYPKQIRVDMEKSVDLEKTEERRRYDNFSSVVSAPLYELASTAIEIANGEAQDCDFDYSGYERNYPLINIDRVFTEKNTRIYTLQNELNFKFATRSCALPGAF